MVLRRLTAHGLSVAEIGGVHRVGRECRRRLGGVAVAPDMRKGCRRGRLPMHEQVHPARGTNRVRIYLEQDRGAMLDEIRGQRRYVFPRLRELSQG